MSEIMNSELSKIADGRRICLLDLNYTLVGNQQETRMLRPFTKRMQYEEYRRDLIEAICGDYVIIVTARPDHQMKATMENLLKKTGWQPAEYYFNDFDAEPPVFKESALKRFIFPKHGMNPIQFYAVESNPKTRAMYRKYGIEAAPYDKFIKNADRYHEIKEKEPEPEQLSLFG